MKKTQNVSPAVQVLMTQIRQIRRKLSLRQEDTAIKASISREAYLRAENCQADARISTIVAMADALGQRVVLLPKDDTLIQQLNELRAFWLGNSPIAATEPGIRTRLLLNRLASILSQIPANPAPQQTQATPAQVQATTQGEESNG